MDALARLLEILVVARGGIMSVWICGKGAQQAAVNPLPARYSEAMNDRVRVIFVSRRNSLRSVLAEGCLTHLAPKKFVAMSCGQPGQVAKHFHPAAIGALGSASIAPPAEVPRSWDALVRGGVRRADFVILLEPQFAADLPRWPGQPEFAVWPLPDIAATADGEESAISTIRILYALRRRLELLASLPLHGSDHSAIRSDVRDLAHLR